MTAEPHPMGTTKHDLRTPERDVWRAVMQALNSPAPVYGNLPDVATGHALEFMLRG
jgi:hypothetical protein